MRISSRSRLVRSLVHGTVGGAAIFGFLFAAAPAEAAFVGATAFYQSAGSNPPSNPPVGNRCTHWVTVQCGCGWYDSPQVRACSELSVEDARQWAMYACFLYCQKNDPWNLGEPGPTGIYSPTSTMSPAAGVLHAAAPGVFQAYAPGSPGPIGQSSDLEGLAAQLTQVTGSPTCWLSGPLDFFGTATPATPGEAPVVVP